MGRIGIIGGSGFDNPGFAGKPKTVIVATPYGSVPVQIGQIAGREAVFLLRHGRDYSLPSEINYRANIAALKRSGVSAVIASAAVGAIEPKMKPGDFAVLTDFLDFTGGKRETYASRAFIDMSEPYDPRLNGAIVKAAKKLKIKLHLGAVYACAEGPRFETKAEIRLYGQAGADVVGMTQVPEVVLAVEAGIPYAAIAVVTNYAAGVVDKKIDPEHVVKLMRGKTRLLSQLIKETIKSVPARRGRG
jgi:5'-methylthioadenosine phosphorylase